MDSGEVEKNRSRELDILKRSEILERAKKSLRGRIFDAAEVNGTQASQFGIDYASYELEELNINRQAADYQVMPASDIEKRDGEINQLEEAIDGASKGYFTQLKNFLLSSSDRIMLDDELYASALKEFTRRMPLRGKSVKRPRPSYLDERFNRVDD